MTASELTLDHCWLRGPQFLYGEETHWPKQEKSVEPDTEDSEVIPQRLALHTHIEENNAFHLLINKFSRLPKLVRIIAWIYRFIRNTLSRRRQTERTITGWLDVSEVKAAMSTIIRQSQLDEFKSEIQSLKKKEVIIQSSRLIKLTPFLDKVGVLREDGSLERSSFSEEVKHPIIIAPVHRIASLIIEHAHVSNHHPSAERLLADIRQEYWILKARSVIRKVLKNCYSC